MLGISSRFNHKRLLDLQPGNLHLHRTPDRTGVPAHLQGFLTEDANDIPVPQPVAEGSKNAGQLCPDEKIERRAVRDQYRYF